MKRIVTIIAIVACLSSCVVPVSDDGRRESVMQPTKPTASPEREPESEPLVETEATEIAPAEEKGDEEVKEEKEVAAVVTVPRIMLAPIPEYPAYIHDRCGAVWGIPSTLQGEYNKEHIKFSTTDGALVSQNEIDLFTLDGALYITHRHTATASDGSLVDAMDYYKQERGDIDRVDSIPNKPAEPRVSFSGVNWLLETTIINGVEFSYLYNLTPEMVESQGNAGGKGAYMGAWPMVSGAVELDRGILIMTGDGALFFPQNRACGNPVSEKGMLWR